MGIGLSPVVFAIISDAPPLREGVAALSPKFSFTLRMYCLNQDIVL